MKHIIIIIASLYFFLNIYPKFSHKKISIWYCTYLLDLYRCGQTSICVCICVRVRVFMCVYMCMRVCSCVCLYVFVCICKDFSLIFILRRMRPDGGQYLRLGLQYTCRGCYVDLFSLQHLPFVMQNRVGIMQYSTHNYK